jgi:hypothetical protein
MELESAISSSFLPHGKKRANLRIFLVDSVTIRYNKQQSCIEG